MVDDPTMLPELLRLSAQNAQITWEKMAEGARFENTPAPVNDLSAIAQNNWSKKPL